MAGAAQFDPDAFMAKQQKATAPAAAFDPDAFMASKATGPNGSRAGTPPAPARGGRGGGAQGQSNQEASQLSGGAVGEFLGGIADTTVKTIPAAAKMAYHGVRAAMGPPTDVAGGEFAQDIGNIVQSHVNQGQKAKEAWKRGDRVEAVGHGLAAAVPVVGPAAAEAAETIGGELEYGDQQHPERPTGMVREPQVARGLGQSVGLIGAASPTNIIKPLASKVGGGIATVADRAGVPEMLERSAGKSYRKMLTPTAKGVVPEAESIAGGPSETGPTGLVKQRPVSLTRSGMMEKQGEVMRDVGPRTSTAYNDKPPLDPAPIIRHLETLRGQKAVVRGSNVVSDPVLNSAIDELKQNLEDMRNADGTIDAVSLDDWKDKLNRGNVSPKGHMRQLAPQTSSAIEKSVAGQIGAYLDHAYPDAARVNAAYRTAKGTNTFLEEQRQAEIAAESGVRTGSSSGFGAAFKKMLPAPVRGIPNAISSLFDSVAWDSVNGATKAKLAEMIRGGSWDTAAEAMKPLPKLLMPPSQQLDAAPDASFVRSVPGQRIQNPARQLGPGSAPFTQGTSVPEVLGKPGRPGGESQRPYNAGLLEAGPQPEPNRPGSSFSQPAIITPPPADTSFVRSRQGMNQPPNPARAITQGDIIPPSDFSEPVFGPVHGHYPNAPNPRRALPPASTIISPKYPPPDAPPVAGATGPTTLPPASEGSFVRGVPALINPKTGQPWTAEELKSLLGGFNPQAKPNIIGGNIR